MLIKNVRTGVVQEVKDRLALALIEKGVCIEVKEPAPVAYKPAPVADKPTASDKKSKYKTKDLKAEA